MHRSLMRKPEVARFAMWVKSGRLEEARSHLQEHPWVLAEDTEDPVHQTWMQLATGGGHVAMVRWLASLGCDLETGSGISHPLANAITRDRLEVAHELLKAGASPNASLKGMPMLHLAAQSQGALATEVLRLLREHGADLEASDPAGTTALCAALDSKQWENSKVLMSMGARLYVDDVDAGGKPGKRNALAAAERSDNISMIEHVWLLAQACQARDEIVNVELLSAGLRPLGQSGQGC